jgi:hypothetical protein
MAVELVVAPEVAQDVEGAYIFGMRNVGLDWERSSLVVWIPAFK